MFYLLYLNTNEILNHFTLKAFCCERRDLSCSHSNSVKITYYFYILRYHVFPRNLTWYFIGVYKILNYRVIFGKFRVQISGMVEKVSASVNYIILAAERKM